MTDLLYPLLTLSVNYGYPVIALAIIVTYLGLPLPTTSLLIAAGSFCATGSMNMLVIIAIATVLSTCGDWMWYTVSRHIGKVTVLRVTRHIGVTPKRVDSVTNSLSKWGAFTIFFSRWLITPLSNPVNIVSGIGKYNKTRFILISGLGELVWASVYIGLGYVFGANWQTLIEYLRNIPAILALSIIGFLLLYAYKRHQHSQSR